MRISLAFKELLLLKVIVLCVMFLGWMAIKNRFYDPSQHRCPIEKVDGTIEDAWLSGLAQPGQRYVARLGNYVCHEVDRGDVVLFRATTQPQPVVRVVRAVPGDEFHLIRTDDGQGWLIEINGHVLMSQDKPYRFGSAAQPVLALYEQRHRGKLSENSYLVFSTVAPGESDSATLGVAAKADLVAKVDLK